MGNMCDCNYSKISHEDDIKNLTFNNSRHNNATKISNMKTYSKSNDNDKPDLGLENCQGIGGMSTINNSKIKAEAQREVNFPNFISVSPDTRSKTISLETKPD